MKAYGEQAKTAAAIILLYVILESAGITCPIKFLTGISCAGCGMSRAWLSIVRGDIAEAFSFHPLFWLPCAAVAVYLFRRIIPAPLYKCFWIGTVILAVGVYIVRMLDPADEIVVFRPGDGFFVRTLLVLKDIAGMLFNG